MLQSVFVGIVLAWAGGYKLTRRASVPALLNRAVYRTVGVVELATAALLVVPPVSPWEPWLAATLFAGFLAYLVYARIAAPTSGCGCLGDSIGPITWRHYARVGMLLAASPWIGQGLHPAVVAVELLALLALSPELDRPIAVGLSRLRPHPLASTAEPAQIPLHATVERLYDSPIYAANASLVRSDVQDHWDVDGWRIVTFAGRRAQTPVTVVFAIPAEFDPDRIRMSIVDAPQPILT